MRILQLHRNQRISSGDIPACDWIAMLGASRELEGSFESEHRDSLIVKFVGTIAVPNYLLYSSPIDGGTFSPQLVLRALLKYHRYQRTIAADEASQPVIHGSKGLLDKVDAYITLAHYYERYGVYQSIIKANAKTGRVDWKQTIGRKQAIHAKNTTIYPNAISRRHVSHENEISELFVLALSHLHRQIVDLLPLAHTSFDQSGEGQDIGIRIMQPGYIEYLINLLENEASRTFHDDDIAAIRSLVVYLKSIPKSPIRSSDSLQTIACTHFEYVWEHMLIAATAKARVDIPKRRPSWHLSTGTTLAYAPGYLRPDTVLRMGEKTYILDAKYYTPFPRHYPGVQDACKQYCYLLANFIDNINNVENAFVLPVANGICEKCVLLGRVNMSECLPMGSHIDKPIMVIGVSMQHMLELYVNNTHGLDAEIALLLDGNQEVAANTGSPRGQDDSMG